MVLSYKNRKGRISNQSKAHLDIEYTVKLSVWISGGRHFIQENL